MNCKPGDLAVIVQPSEWLGWIVEVVSRVPPHEFTAPDGTRFAKPITSEWLVKAPRVFVRPPYVDSCYAMVPDYSLRPIRDPGDDAKDEMLRPLTADAWETLVGAHERHVERQGSAA